MDPNMIEALEILNAPQAVKFNLTTLNTWLRSEERKVKLLQCLEWLNGEFKAHNKAMDEHIEKLRNANGAAKLELDFMREAVDALPRRFNRMVTIDEAVKACSKSYNAGYACAAKQILTPDDSEITKRATALKIIQAETNRAWKFISDNALLDEAGNIKADLNGMPL
jgi:hypothetical protein